MSKKLDELRRKFIVKGPVVDQPPPDYITVTIRRKRHIGYHGREPHPLAEFFPLGCRVRQTKEWIKTNGGGKRKEGRVVGYGQGLQVQLDGQKSSSGWHPSFWQRIPAAAAPPKQEEK